MEEMVEEGRTLSAIHENVVVKVPVGVPGLRAAKKMREENIDTNVTLIFNPAQALLAAKAGASFVSPFVGRIDDIGQHGMEMVGDIVRIFQNYDFPTQVLVASVRSSIHLPRSGRHGGRCVDGSLPGDRPASQASFDRYRFGKVSGRQSPREPNALIA